MLCLFQTLFDTQQYNNTENKCLLKKCIALCVISATADTQPQENLVVTFKHATCKQTD